MVSKNRGSGSSAFGACSRTNQLAFGNGPEYRLVRSTLHAVVPSFSPWMRGLAFSHGFPTNIRIARHPFAIRGQLAIATPVLKSVSGAAITVEANEWLWRLAAAASLGRAHAGIASECSIDGFDLFDSLDLKSNENGTPNTLATCLAWSSRIRDVPSSQRVTVYWGTPMAAASQSLRRP